MTTDKAFLFCEDPEIAVKQHDMSAQTKDLESQKTVISPESGAVTFEDLLVAVGKSRNRDAFIRVFEYFAPRVKSFLMKRGMTPEMADELAQEVMLTVWHRAKSFDPQKAKASTWIYTIARNKKIDWLRQQKWTAPDAPEESMIEDDKSHGPHEVMARMQESEAITEAMKDLPPEQAEVIHKAFFEDKTHQEIAKEMDVPLGTVKSRIRLAMDRLHHKLGGLGL